MREDLAEFVIDGTDWAIPSNGLDGWGEYDNDITIVDNAIGDGGIVSSERMASKDRTITAKSRHKNINHILRAQATAFFNNRMTYKVYLTYMEKTLWAEGKIQKFMLPTENIHRDMTLTVVFLFPNPYLRSYEDFGKNIASITAMAGFPYICTARRGAPTGMFNFAKKVVLANDGAVETYCRAIFLAKGTVTNPKLIINGHYVRVIDVMAENDVIEIDFVANPPTVKKNGVNYIGHCDRTSEFDYMALQIGDSEIEFDADDGTNLLDVSIYYNKLSNAI